MAAGIKMGWLVCGRGYGQKWNRAWEKAHGQVCTAVENPDDCPAEALLDFMRHIVKRAAEIAGVDAKDRAKKHGGLEEVYEEPSRSLEQLRELCTKRI